MRARRRQDSECQKVRYTEAEPERVRPLLARQEGEAQPQRWIVHFSVEHVAGIGDIDVNAALPAIDPREDVLKINERIMKWHFPHERENTVIGPRLKLIEKRES